MDKTSEIFFEAAKKCSPSDPCRQTLINIAGAVEKYKSKDEEKKKCST